MAHRGHVQIKIRRQRRQHFCVKIMFLAFLLENCSRPVFVFVLNEIYENPVEHLLREFNCRKDNNGISTSLFSLNL